MMNNMVVNLSVFSRKTTLTLFISKIFFQAYTIFRKLLRYKPKTTIPGGFSSPIQ